MVLEKTLESPLDCKEIQPKESILKEISPGCSLEGLMLKLKLQCFGHLMRRTDIFEKTWCWERLRVGGEGDNRGWDGWMASSTQWKWVWVSSGNWWWMGKPGVPQSMGLQRAGRDRATGLNWTVSWHHCCCFIKEHLSPVLADAQAKASPGNKQKTGFSWFFFFFFPCTISWLLLYHMN